MDKVYVVLSAYCGDPFEVHKVFKNKVDADKCCKDGNENIANEGFEDYVVSEYEVS